jgi:hypothetical protein
LIGGSAAVAGELRVVLSYLSDRLGGEPDRLDELRARRAARRLDLLLGDVERAGGNGTIA